MTRIPVSGPTAKIGLIGAGGIAGEHVKAYAAHPDTITFTAVADPVHDAAVARAGDTGAQVFADYRTMLAEADIDAVDICLPHHLHRDAIVAAAEAGKHILCEKPLCLTMEEAADVQAAVERSGVTLMCAHNQLFFPAVAKAKELISSGALGDLYEVRTTDSFVNHFDPANMGWRAHAATSGGGELIDTGYHPTYLMLHLAGAAPSQVASMLATHRLKFMEGEDSANVMVRFDNGVIGTLVTSWAYREAPGTERFSAVGEKGSLSSDGTTLVVTRGDADAETLAFEPVDGFTAELGHFARSLLDGTRPINTELEGVQVLQMILAAYESARSGRFVDIAELEPVAAR